MNILADAVKMPLGPRGRNVILERAFGPPLVALIWRLPRSHRGIWQSHMARGIGEALYQAYKGELDFHYSPEQNLLRVSWIH